MQVSIFENATSKITTRKDKEQILFFVPDITLPEFVNDIEVVKDLPSDFSSLRCSLRYSLSCFFLCFFFSFSFLLYVSRDFAIFYF